MNGSETNSESSNENSEDEKKVEDSSSESSSEEDKDVSKVEEGDGIDNSHISDTMSSQPHLPEPFVPRRKRFVPNYEVEGAFKVILSEDTQVAIEMEVGNHVNSQFPWKLVDKEKILQSIENYSESEFNSLKDEIKAYPQSEILMGYIPDESSNYDEFFICLTIKARDHCKEQSNKFIKRQQKKLDKAMQKKPRPWISLGSEHEIAENNPIYARPLLETEITAKFPIVYDPKQFEPRPPLSVRDGYIELTPYRQKFNNIYRRRVDNATQVALPKKSSFAQTALRYPRNMWTQSVADNLGSYTDPGAGGDADQVNIKTDKKDSNDEESSSEEEEQKPLLDDADVAVFRNAFKRMRRLSYVKQMNEFMTDRATEMHDLLELNAVMDIYSNDYPKLAAKKVASIYDTMAFEEYICFTDVRSKDKYISSVAFHPMWSGIVAVCYADGSPTVLKHLSTRPDPIQRAVYGLNPVMIWSHVDSLFPRLYLECPREVKVLAFCPFDENILLGGCVNGQVVIWDLTNKLEKVEVVEVLNEKRTKSRIAINDHMGWFKNIHDSAVLQPTAMSNLMTSHFGPVTCIKWLSPNFVIGSTGKVTPIEENKHSQIFFTGSEDGSILIWNLSLENVSSQTEKKVKKSKRVLIRPSDLLQDVSPLQILDRVLQPVYKIVLGEAGKSQLVPLQSFALDRAPVRYHYTPKASGMGRKYFKCEILEQNEDLLRTIYVGSQHGETLRVSWEGHAFNTGEVVNSEFCEMQYKCCIHDGIITRVQRNHMLNHLTLTVGGKIFAIWHEHLFGRPLTWKKRNTNLTDGVWSMYKPSIIYLSTADGNLETWDILLRSDQPIAVQTFSGNMLIGVSIHTLPIKRNIIAANDINGSFRMFLVPPIFMLQKPSYTDRMERLLNGELRVMQSFLAWQAKWMEKNTDVLLEMKRKEALMLLEAEEEKRKLKAEEENRREEEERARAKAKAKVVGPEQRWQLIIAKLIERTIAVKKRIDREELLFNEKPLRELEAQRLEKERKMLEVMKNQKTIFNDTVAILFPEAIKKIKVKETCKIFDKANAKKIYLEDYKVIRDDAFKMIRNNPYSFSFTWEATLEEGKERRQALCAYEDYLKMHAVRLECDEGKEPDIKQSYKTLDATPSTHSTITEGSQS